MTYAEKEKWFSLSLIEQMTNIGADVCRAISWKNKDNEKSSEFFMRSLALLDLTIEDKKNRSSSLKEICRLKEVLADYFIGGNLYDSDDKKWNNYFLYFNSVAAAERGF